MVLAGEESLKVQHAAIASPGRHLFAWRQAGDGDKAIFFNDMFASDCPSIREMYAYLLANAGANGEPILPQLGNSRTPEPWRWVMKYLSLSDCLPSLGLLCMIADYTSKRSESRLHAPQSEIAGECTQQAYFYGAVQDEWLRG